MYMYSVLQSIQSLSNGIAYCSQVSVFPDRIAKFRQQ